PTPRRAVEWRCTHPWNANAALVVIMILLYWREVLEAWHSGSGRWLWRRGVCCRSCGCRRNRAGAAGPVVKGVGCGRRGKDKGVICPLSVVSWAATADCRLQTADFLPPPAPCCLLTLRLPG